jgi:hypothetical protein
MKVGRLEGCLLGNFVGWAEGMTVGRLEVGWPPPVHLSKLKAGGRLLTFAERASANSKLLMPVPLLPTPQQIRPAPMPAFVQDVL